MLTQVKKMAPPASPKETKSNRSWYSGIIGLFELIIIIYIILYLSGASFRGITKFIERDALKTGHIPNEFVFVLWGIVNSIFFGIPGLVMNYTVPDPFEGVAVVRTSAGGGAFHTAVHPTLVDKS